jgi:L-2-hydroxyglutarate oxidase LhgO
MLSFVPISCSLLFAGVIGLSVGAALSKSGRSVWLVERHGRAGEETSSRNSEVIHAGIYYPTNSLKAQLCVRGKRMLYEYAAAHGIGHSRVGKLVVCSSANQMDALQNLAAQARSNGVDDCKLLSAEECKRLEPSVVAVAGLHSPSTGIIDSHALMAVLEGEIQQV